MRTELPHRYPEIDEHLGPGPESGESIREMSRSSTLWTNEASIYCSSIKQRERKYFRQLIFCSQDLWASLRGSACLHDHSTSCQNRSTPNFNELFKKNSEYQKLKTSEFQDIWMNFQTLFETHNDDSKKSLQSYTFSFIYKRTIYKKFLFDISISYSEII